MIISKNKILNSFLIKMNNQSFSNFKLNNPTETTLNYNHN